MKILVTGAGGFIGGHLVKYLVSKNYQVKTVDIKPLSEWFQLHNNAQNFVLDLKNYDACLNCSKDCDWIYNLACNMGGISFIEKNISSCLFNVLINTNMVQAAIQNKCKRYFFSSTACVYNRFLQKDANSNALKEEDAYPAMPDEGYGWEKLFSEKLCQSVNDEGKLTTRIARFHNVYGPFCSFCDGKERVPAAISFKIAKAKIIHDLQIDIWGDGKQSRSFMYVDDCIEGIEKIMNSDFSEPLNLGISKGVSINHLVETVEKIAEISVHKNYLLDRPVGVAGRNSDNTKIKKLFGWEPTIDIETGLFQTYEWIYNQCITNGIINENSF